jgi:N-acetylmuramoyl-L-alanine amidase
MPGIIGETFYVTLPSGAAYLLQEDTRQTIAQAYADALQDFLTTAPNP